MCVPILGAVVSGIGAAMQVSQQRNQANMQADLEKRNANQQREIGAYQGNLKQRQLDTVYGSQRAGLAASGVDIGYGSAQDVQQATTTEGQMDVAAIRWNSDLAANRMDEQSKITRASAPSSAAVGLAFVSPIIKTIGDMGKQAFMAA